MTVEAMMKRHSVIVPRYGLIHSKLASAILTMIGANTSSTLIARKLAVAISTKTMLWMRR